MFNKITFSGFGLVFFPIMAALPSLLAFLDTMFLRFVIVFAYNNTNPFSRVTATDFTPNCPENSFTLRRAFSAFLSNYNRRTVYICRRIIPITAFLVIIVFYRATQLC